MKGLPVIQAVCSEDVQKCMLQKLGLYTPTDVATLVFSGRQCWIQHVISSRETARVLTQPAVVQAVERTVRKTPNIVPYLSPKPSDESRRPVRMMREAAQA